MTAWNLPTSLTIGGVGYPIMTDYRVVLDILQSFLDPSLEDDEKWLYCCDRLFDGLEKLPAKDYEEAVQAAARFIDADMANDGKPKPHLMDWQQDAPIIIPAINRVLGKEIRAVEYMHWWTFLGAYMEIGESLYSSVLGIRQKRARGKKLEKHEMEFYKENKALIDLKRACSGRSEEEKQ